MVTDLRSHLVGVGRHSNADLFLSSSIVPLSWGQAVWGSENAPVLPLIGIPRVVVRGEVQMGLQLA